MTTLPLARARGLVDTPPEKPRPCPCPALEPLTAPAPLEGAGLRLRPLHHWPLGDQSRRVTTDTRGLLSDAARGGQLGRRPAARAPLLVGPRESKGFHSLIGDTNPRYQTQQQTGLRAQRPDSPTPHSPRLCVLWPWRWPLPAFLGDSIRKGPAGALGPSVWSIATEIICSHLAEGSAVTGKLRH